MTRGTSIDELYDVLNAVIEQCTGYPCWRKTGIQNAPRTKYATIHITGGPTPALDVVELVEIEDAEAPDYSITEVSWGATELECKAEFFRGGVAGAYDAAVRFSNALKLQKRYLDLYLISGLAGRIVVRDVTTMFRADVEGRSEVIFDLNANVCLPLPLPDTGINEMETQGVDVYRDAEVDPIATISVSTDGITKGA